MSGKLIKVVEPSHICDGVPKIWDFFKLKYDAGTQWQCDDCEDIWEVVATFDGVNTGREWRRVGGIK